MNIAAAAAAAAKKPKDDMTDVMQYTRDFSIPPSDSFTYLHIDVCPQVKVNLTPEK